VAAARGLSFDDMRAVALDGVEASWLGEGEKRGMRAAFSEELAALAEVGSRERSSPP
jgi:hypothetical protein